MIIHGDCIEKLKRIENYSVDLAVCDPPYYNVSKDDYDHTFENKNEWLKWMIHWVELTFFTLKNGGSFYVFGGIGKRNGFAFWNFVEKLSECFTFVSYINWRRFRPKAFRAVNSWADAREDIAFFCKGDKPKTFNKQYMNECGLSAASIKRFADAGTGMLCSNIWIDIKEAQLDGKPNRTLEHPDQKPVQLIERIVSASSVEGDLVIDPFAGSGTTGIACKNLNRRFILIEKDKKYADMIEKRLKSYKPRLL